MAKNISSIIQEGFSLFTQNWQSLILTCLPLCALLIFSSLVDAYFALNPQNLAIDIYHPVMFYSRLGLLTITFLLMCATQLGNIHLSLNAVKSRIESPQNYLFSYPIQQFLQYFILWLILIACFIPVVVIAGIGLLFLIIPGLLIITIYKLWAILLVYHWVDDKQSGNTKPLGDYFKSATLVFKTHWVKTLQLGCLMLGIIIGLALILFIPITILTSTLLFLNIPVELIAVLSAIVNSILYVILNGFVFVVAVYYQEITSKI